MGSIINILGLGGDLIASRRPDAGSYNYFFYHQDVRGSTVNIADRNGNLAKGYEYDEFGNLTRQAGSFYNETTFTGSVMDSATGLQYMNARFYEPQTGRFLSQDTYSGNPYDPWTQHLYSYCGNNPTSMIDPTGHYFLTPSEDEGFMERFRNRPIVKRADPVVQNSQGAVGNSVAGGENSVWDESSGITTTVKTEIRKETIPSFMIMNFEVSGTSSFGEYTTYGQKGWLHSTGYTSTIDRFKSISITGPTTSIGDLFFGNGRIGVKNGNTMTSAGRAKNGTDLNVVIETRGKVDYMNVDLTIKEIVPATAYAWILGIERQMQNQQNEKDFRELWRYRPSYDNEGNVIPYPPLPPLPYLPYVYG